MDYTNELGQPVGAPLPDWTARPRPPCAPMLGRLCRLEPLEAKRHAAALHEAYSADREGGTGRICRTAHSRRPRSTLHGSSW